jgi:hypothetical protein
MILKESLSMETKALPEFREGLSEIERQFSASIQSKSPGGSLPDFAWSSMPTPQNIPDVVEVDVRWQGREVRLRFTRQQVEDSWSGVSDAYAKAVVQEGVRRLIG